MVAKDIITVTMKAIAIGEHDDILIPMLSSFVLCLSVFCYFILENCVSSIGNRTYLTFVILCMCILVYSFLLGKHSTFCLNYTLPGGGELLMWACGQNDM